MILSQAKIREAVERGFFELTSELTETVALWCAPDGPVSGSNTDFAHLKSARGHRSSLLIYVEFEPALL